LFYCNPWAQFMTATGDASTLNKAHSADADNSWWPLTFRHHGKLSRIEHGGGELYLAGSGSAFIADLGLSSHSNCDDSNCDSPPSGGLAGNLATLVSLVAFSCKAKDLDHVLLLDQAWWHDRWQGHNRGSGRELNMISAGY
jgi:hypothetical protein